MKDISVITVVIYACLVHMAGLIAVLGLNSKEPKDPKDTKGYKIHKIKSLILDGVLGINIVLLIWLCILHVL